MRDTLLKEVHDLPRGFVNDIGIGRIGLSYAEFLAARRPLIASLVRAGCRKLAGETV